MRCLYLPYPINIYSLRKLQPPKPKRLQPQRDQIDQDLKLTFTTNQSIQNQGIKNKVENWSYFVSNIDDLTK